MGRPRTKALPSGIYARPLASGRANYWITFRTRDGERVREFGGATIEEAKHLLAQRRAAVAGDSFEKGKGSGEQSLATYSTRWLEYRRTSGVRSAEREEQVLRDHILPTLGSYRLCDIRPRHVSQLVAHLEAGPLSSKSVRNVHGVLSALLTRARFEELVFDNAAKGLPRGELPKIKRTREVSAWTRAEVERWITPRADVPEVFTMAYAIASFTGARVGEVAGLRWRDLDTEARPLWRWALRTQYDGAPLKTDNPRDIPIHAELQRILAAWKLEGWPRLMCRHPKPDDFVVPRPYRYGPRPTVAHHTEQSLGVKTVRYYAQRVGVDDTGRDFHSFRRAMITIARTDGASKDVLERVTHNAAGEMIDGYTYFGWEALCEAVSAIRLAPLRGVVAVRRIKAAASGETVPPEGADGHATGHATPDTPQEQAVLLCPQRGLNQSPEPQRPRFIEDSGESGQRSTPTNPRSFAVNRGGVSALVTHVTTAEPTAPAQQGEAEDWTAKQLAELAALASMARTALEAGASTVALEAVRQIEAVAALDGPAYRARWAEKHREGGPA